MAHHIGPSLQEFCLFYATLLSYEEVADLVERVTGEPLISDQCVWDIVHRKACALSRGLQENVSHAQEQMPPVAERIDVYSHEPEVLLYADAILVTRQKSERSRSEHEATLGGNAPPGGLRSPSTPPLGNLKSKATASGRVSTDVMMLQQKDGDFRYLTGGITPYGQELVSIEEATKAFLRQEYGMQRDDRTTEPLNVVAITDGASSIRSQLLGIFGHPIPVILDWFHLRKKLHEKMSMIARNKSEKQEHVKSIARLLWQGKVEEAKHYLERDVVCRNDRAREELLGYLEKHAEEIIDYEKRRAAGKTIGSGPVENGVDQIVGQRQKQKAMSWSDRGSKALAILETTILNREWKKLWQLPLTVTA